MTTEPQIPLRRWTVDEFDRMSETGVLSPRGYELLDGVVYDTNGYLRRWSVRDYGRMAEAGLITEEERAELVEGCVVQPLGFKWRRASLGMRLSYLLWDAVREAGIVSRVSSVVLDDETMICPDLAVLHYRDDFYADQYPGSEDVSLVVEIADPLSSHYHGTKRGLYAKAGVAELWELEPGGGVVVVCLVPESGKYRERREYRHGDSWISPALGGREVRVADVLGPPRAE